MKTSKYLAAVFLIVATFFAVADSHATERKVNWKAEDCKKVSDASAFFLFISGQLLERYDELDKKGEKRKSKESFELAVAFSELARNYAKNFEVYCKLTPGLH